MTEIHNDRAQDRSLSPELKTSLVLAILGVIFLVGWVFYLH